MNFELTEEQKQIKALIKEFGQREIDTNKITDMAHAAGRATSVQELRDKMPWDLIKKMNDVGLRQLASPEKYGGGGVTVGGHVTRAIACEALGYYWELGGRLLSQPWFTIQGVAGRHTTEAQKDYFFSRYMADPTMQVATVGSEPAGNTDLSLPYEPDVNPEIVGNLTARKEGNEWVLNGDKMFASGSGVAGLLLVTARTDKGPISKAESFIVVEKDAPGLTQTVNHLIGGEIFGNCQNHFDNVRVPAEALMGEVNKGRLLAADVYSAKMIAYIDIFGHGQKVYEQVVEYAKQRISGGRPIIQHSHIAQMLGEMSIRMEACRAHIWRSSWEADQRQIAGVPQDLYWTMSVFHHIRKLCWDLCQMALEVYGGVGVTPEMPVERYLRRVATWYITGGVPSMNAIKCSMLHNNHKIQACK